MKSGFAFIASNLIISGPFPIEILPNHVVRPASDSEIEIIRAFIAKSTPGAHAQWVNYESVVKEEKYDGRTALHIDALPRNAWKYWVLAFESGNSLIHEIESMSNLLPVDIDMGFQIYFSQPNQSGEQMGWSIPPMHIIEKYTSHDQIFRNAREISANQLKQIGEFWRLHSNLDDRHAFVKSALQTFTALKRVPRSYGLFVVGLFSIIESLITHAPRLTETLDSINHQISNKIILLRKRYTKPILPNAYFLTAAEESIWKKLYSYRSGVAHGSTITFDGELQVLKAHDSVVNFLSDNVRELIVLALSEPEFILDLRKC